MASSMYVSRIINSVLSREATFFVFRSPEHTEKPDMILDSFSVAMIPYLAKTV